MCVSNWNYDFQGKIWYQAYVFMLLNAEIASPL